MVSKCDKKPVPLAGSQRCRRRRRRRRLCGQRGTACRAESACGRPATRIGTSGQGRATAAKTRKPAAAAARGIRSPRAKVGFTLLLLGMLVMPALALALHTFRHLSSLMVKCNAVRSSQAIVRRTEVHLLSGRAFCMPPIMQSVAMKQCKTISFFLLLLFFLENETNNRRALRKNRQELRHDRFTF